MAFRVEDMDDQSKYRKMLSIPYNELITFVLAYIRKGSGLIYFFWTVCLLFAAIGIIIRINITGHFPGLNILLHSAIGFIVFPILCIPLHELLHIIPYYLSGARNIKAGMDLKQYIFYVTAHRYVASPIQFIIVAVVPFTFISITSVILVFALPGLWKWSLSAFLFAHATMCAGDFALLNFYYLNREKKIYTWDDANLKIAYFYEKL